MKKTIFVIAVLIIIVSIFAVLSSSSDSKKDNAYYTESGKVYYSALLFGSRGAPQVVYGADAASFKNRRSGTGEEYGTDKNFVYCAGKKIEGSDGKSFNDSDPNYAFDKNQAYYPYCTIIPNADGASFQVVSAGTYAKDNKHVYLYGKAIPIADPASFQLLENPYMKDKNSIYYYSHRTDEVKGEIYEVKRIEGADVSSFVVLGNGIAKDKHHTYTNGLVN